MKIDSHQHFWRLGRGDYPWPDDSVAAILRDFEPDDLKPLLAAAGVEKTVLVQATDTVAETEFLLGLASKHSFIAGVVGWVDLAAPDAGAEITRLAANPALKGLRPMLQTIEDTDWILGEEVQPALRQMQDLGLRFDALIQPRHLAVTAALARRYPDTAVIIDHIAKPAMGGGISPDAAWLSGMQALAAQPNCFCKLSGMVTEAGTGWTEADLAPFASAVLKAFGPARLMWGSDWPVVNLAADYAAWDNCTQNLLADLSAADRARVLSGTAAEAYGL